MKLIDFSPSVDNETLTALSEPFLDRTQKMPSERNSGSTLPRKAVIGLAVLLILTGIGLTIAALLLPSWQVVQLFEYSDMHEHGLWLDCVRFTRADLPLMQRFESVSEPLNCIYKWDYDAKLGTRAQDDPESPVGEVNRHQFFGWQVATLTLLGLTILTAIISTCFACCACSYRYLTLLFTAVTLLTTCACAIALILFFFYSHRADNRFISGIVSTYEQKLGLAYFLALGACLAYFLAFLVSLLAALFAFKQTTSSTDDDQFSIGRISRSTGPNIQRTMQVDPPLLFQQTTGASIIRSPPHYTKFQSNYSKSPAASMPELLPTAEPRPGSETCV
ncbi:unnamed protein product [Anisakis simplex]|uniref:Uncharacterized protein n=1 Tax=Anisakis simplex TaxID=6269 RepID=A0A158PN21_ANISI|nr:unnamed protein product [Anisakis simplex]